MGADMAAACQVRGPGSQDGLGLAVDGPEAAGADANVEGSRARRSRDEGHIGC